QLLLIGENEDHAVILGHAGAVHQAVFLLVMRGCDFQAIEPLADLGVDYRKIAWRRRRLAGRQEQREEEKKISATHHNGFPRRSFIVKRKSTNPRIIINPSKTSTASQTSMYRLGCFSGVSVIRPT